MTEIQKWIDEFVKANGIQRHAILISGNNVGTVETYASYLYALDGFCGSVILQEMIEAAANLKEDTPTLQRISIITSAYTSAKNWGYHKKNPSNFFLQFNNTG